MTITIHKPEPRPDTEEEKQVDKACLFIFIVAAIAGTIGIVIAVFLK